MLVVRRIQLAVQGARGSSDTQQRRNADLQANETTGLLVDSGLIIKSGQEWAREQLRIPQADFGTKTVQDFGIPEKTVREAVQSIRNAQADLEEAAQLYSDALKVSGFGPVKNNAVLGVVKGLTPITMAYVNALSAGGQIKNINQGQMQLQAVESQLHAVGQQLKQVLSELQQTGAMQLPRQPLAMHELLSALNPSQPKSLPSCSHPVIVVLYHAEQKALQEAQNSGGLFGPRQPRRPGLITSLLGAHSQGEAAQQNMAKAMAGHVAVADLLELQRLTVQLQALHHWTLYQWARSTHKPRAVGLNVACGKAAGHA